VLQKTLGEKSESGTTSVQTIANAAFDKKGYDILALDVSALVDYTDCFVLVSGKTEQHVKALWSNIKVKCAEADLSPLFIEGEDHNRWVLMDFGHIMVHVFIDSLRQLYELERLWADSVRLDLELPEVANGFADDDDLWEE